MVIFRGPSGASEEFSYAIELVAQTEHKGQRAHLVAAPEKIDEAVRETLDVSKSGGKR